MVVRKGVVKRRVCRIGRRTSKSGSKREGVYTSFATEPAGTGARRDKRPSYQECAGCHGTNRASRDAGGLFLDAVKARWIGEVHRVGVACSCRRAAVAPRPKSVIVRRFVYWSRAIDRCNFGLYGRSPPPRSEGCPSMIVLQAVPKTCPPRKIAAAVVAVVAVLLFHASSAGAVTEVSGHLDTNAPLEIAPADDPLVADLDVAGSRPVAFIQKMPVTKKIQKVTIGDLGRADRCTTDPRVSLSIREHASGVLDAVDGTSSNGVGSSQTYLPLDASLTKRTWTLTTPAVLRKDRSYSFHLTWHSSYCGYVKQRTWAHHQPQVNAGSATCAAEPLIGEAGTAGVRRRMWHLQGLDDRNPFCATTPSSEEAFHPSMPGGWLATHTYGGGTRYVAGHTHYPNTTGPHQQCGDEARFGGTGAIEAFWRNKPNYSPTAPQYICKFEQYGPPGVDVADGWYYGLPWRTERNGAPRDIYLKLETIDYNALMTRYAPILRYDSAEEFRVVSPGAMTDFYDETSLLQDDSNALLDSATFAIADQRYVDQPPGDLSRLSLSFLGATYADPVETNGRREGTDAEASDYVSARGNASDDLYDDDSDAMFGRDGYANRVYVRVAHGADSRVWVQYWVFYYFNSLVPVHEGDWELVQVGLNEVTHAPERAVYAQHGGGEWCPWTSAQKVGDQPVVYVARHSHASYFEPVLEGSIDVADGQGGPAPVLQTEEISSTSPGWVSWPGKWGDSDTSPEGPGQGPGNTPRWDSPGIWSDDITSCE